MDVDFRNPNWYLIGPPDFELVINTGIQHINDMYLFQFRISDVPVIFDNVLEMSTLVVYDQVPNFTSGAVLTMPNSDYFAFPDHYIQDDTLLIVNFDIGDEAHNDNTTWNAKDLLWNTSALSLSSEKLELNYRSIYFPEEEF